MRSVALLLAAAAATSVVALVPVECPAGYTTTPFSCLKYVGSEDLNWYDANARCALEEGYLAEFDDQVAIDLLYAVCLGKRCWLGANDVASEGTYRWSSDNRVVSSFVTSMWGPGEPNNCCGGEDCMHLWNAIDPDPSINDYSCTGQVNKFLCERPLGCPAGFFKASENLCTQCPRGKYQPSISINPEANACINCAAGRWGNVLGEVNPNCEGLCDAGHYCPSGSTSRTPFVCPAGKYGATTGLGTASCSGNSAPGHYTNAGSTLAAPTSGPGGRCPAGKYGAGGASNPTECSGPCQAGYFCPLASASATASDCGGPDKFCPEGSATASNVAGGHYSVPTSSGTANNRIGEQQCEPGFQCNAGVRAACPAGTFVATAGSSTCPGVCQAGFFCPAGSSTGSAEPCGGVNLFCPSGSGSPTTVSNGFYSVPENAPTDQRTAQVACTEDEFCTGGERFKRIQFSSTCTNEVTPGGNAFTDQYSVTENDVGATVASIPYIKRGTEPLAVRLRHVGAGTGSACPAAATSMLEVDHNAGAFTASVRLQSGQFFNFEGCDTLPVLVEFELTAATTSPLFTCLVNINVQDANDRPVFDYSSRSTGNTFLREVFENARLRSTVPVLVSDTLSDSTLLSTDEDDGQEVRYDIISGNIDDSFSVGACSGQLFVNAFPISHEVRSVYNLVVRVTDNGIPPLSATTSVTLEVLDIAEAPVFQNNPYTLSVEENAPTGTSLGMAVANTVLALDEDAGDSLVYSMVVLDSDPNDPPFELLPSGELHTRRVLDYEAALDPTPVDGTRQFRVTFTVEDTPSGASRPSHTVTHAQTIDLVDTNDPPRLLDIGVNNQPAFTDTFPLDEEVPTGTSVGVIQAEDSDGDDIASMVITGPYAANFAITMNTGTEWEVTFTAGRLDFETVPIIAFPVTITDDDPVDPRSITFTLTINLRDVNEVPTVAPGQSVSFVENSAINIGSTGTLTATDPDFASGQETLVWEVQQASGWTATGGSPTTASGTAVLRSTVARSYEVATSYTIQVRVTDRSGTGLTSPWESVTVNILNENEPPIIAPGQVFTISENPAPDSIIGMVQFTDDDSNWLPTGETSTFTGVAGSDVWNARDGSEALFKILPNGQLRANDGILVYPWQSGLDFETKSSFTFTVRVEDAGIDGPVMWDNTTVTVVLTDVDEAPLVPPQNLTVPETSGIGTPVGNGILVLDQENSTAAAVTCTVDTQVVGAVSYGIAGDCSVSVVAGNTGDLTDGTIRLDPISVTGLDEALQAHTFTINVLVGSGNTAPVWSVGANSPISIDEGIAAMHLDLSTLFTDVDTSQTHGFFLTNFVPSQTSGWVTIDQTGPNALLMSTTNSDFERFTSFTVDVIVQDSGPGQFTDSMTLPVTVVNVNEAPVINATALYTVFSTEETDFTESGPVMNKLLGSVAAYDVDVGDTLTFTLSGADAPQFSVPGTALTPCLVQCTAPLSVAGTVSHEDKGALASHVFTVTATDNDGLSTSATVSVTVTDNNEPPTITTTYMGSPEAFRVAEDPAGLPLVQGRRLSFLDTTNRASPATVSAEDPDINDGLRRRLQTFSIMPGSAGFGIFEVSNNIALEVVDGVALDFETQSSYTVNVTTCDGGPLVGQPQYCSSHVFPVTISDVADLAVTDIYTVNTASRAENVLVPTTGSSDIEVYFFGNDLAAPADLATISIQVTGTYHTEDDTPLPPIVMDRTAPANCRLHNSTAMSCVHPEGIGRVSWQVVIGGEEVIYRIQGQDSQDSVAGTTQFMPPVITGVQEADGLLNTIGGDTLVVTGTNFGPSGVALSGASLSYGGNKFAAGACFLSVPHTEMNCVSAEGYGVDLDFEPRVGGQVGTGLQTGIAYNAPNITSIVMNTANQLAPTVGGSTFTLLGDNFGPASLGLQVTLGGASTSVLTSTDACNSPVSRTYSYEAAQCSRLSTSPHSAITCTMPEGAGQDLAVIVNSGEENSGVLRTPQTSATTAGSAPVTVSYEPPTISDAFGPGVFRGDTQGRQLISVLGDNLGRTAPCYSTAIEGGLCPGTNEAITQANTKTGGASYEERVVLEYAKTSDIASMGAGNASWFVASNCVVRSTGVAECCSAEGTGAGFTYRLSVAGQASTNMLAVDGSGYHPPVVSRYSEVGASSDDFDPPLSPTRGNYKLRIQGSFFGADASTLEAALYGLSDEFTADISECVMTSPHSEFTCETVQGAGADLSWTLTVDGQESEVPATDYGVPHITHFLGPAATGASTSGGESITIKGRNFGPLPTPGLGNATQLAPGEFPVFLDFVRYGAVTGQEYTARNCSVVDHETIQCNTAPGSGSDLIWTVSIEDQLSEDPDTLWSYAEPTLGAMTFLDGTSVTTAGGVRVQITGTNFASADPETRLRVRITSPYYTFVNSPEYAQYWLDQGMEQAFQAPSTVTPFTDLAVTGRVISSRRGRQLQTEAVEFTIPPGVGTGVQVQLVQVPKGLGLDSATLSNPLTFDYAAPGAPVGVGLSGFIYRTADLDLVTTRITIIGSSLGRSFSNQFFDGFVYIDDEVVQPENIELWSHSEIKVLYTKAGVSDPNNDGGSAAGNLLDDHYHVRVDIFDRVQQLPTTTDTVVCGTPATFTVDVTQFNSTLNATVTTTETVSNCTLEAVPTGGLEPPSPTFHSSSEEVVGTSPVFVGRVDDGLPKGTAGGDELAFVASNIGNDTSLMYVTVGENAVLRGAMDGESPPQAVARDNECAVTSINYNEVTRQGVVRCTMPAGQGEFNPLRFYWNNKSPETNNASSAEDLELVAYRTPSVVSLSAAAAVGASDPVVQTRETYESGVGGPFFQTESFLFPTEGGSITVSGADFGLTGGMAYLSQRDIPAGRPAEQFAGEVQALDGGEFSYMSPTAHSHTGMTLTVPPSMNLVPNNQYLMRVRHCGAVGCPTFSSVLPVCDGSLTASPGQVCDTPDSRLATNVEFVTTSNLDPRGTFFAAQGELVTTYPGAPQYIAYHYAPPTIDATATVLLATTRGGDILRIAGTNFGPAGAQPAEDVVVTVGGNNCTVRRDGVTGDRLVDVGASPHTQLQCIMPPGVGANVPVVVRIGAATVTLPSTLSQVSYLPPVVTNMWPRSGPTSGLNTDGSRIRVWLAGDNFGTSGVTISLRSNPDFLAQDADVNVPTADITVYNDTLVSFWAPEGQGRQKIVEVMVGGQSTQDVLSNNHPPAASWPEDGVDFSAAPWAPLVWRYDDPIITDIRGSVGTRGGIITLQGRNFGNRDCGTGAGTGSVFAVTVALFASDRNVNMACSADEFCASHNHERVLCRVPAGTGTGYDVTLTIGGRATTNLGAFSFLPPQLEDVSPTPARADTDFTLTLVGQNFGSPGASPVNITIGEVPCLNARVEESEGTTLDILKCESQAQTVGPKNLTITVAHQTVFYPVSEGWVELFCPTDYWGQVGEVCEPCPAGASCFNHAVPDESCDLRVPNVGCMLYKEPISAPAAWRFYRPTPEALCPTRGNRPGNFSGFCPVFVGCDPPEACSGNNDCSRGYTEIRCAVCDVGFFRLDGECQACPDLGWLFILLFIVGILLVCCAGMWLNRQKVNLAFMSIGVDYFQVLGLFARAKIDWPPAIKSLLSALSVFNLNIDLAAPECASPDMTYTQKWLGVMMLPPLIFSIFFVAYLAKYVFKRWVKKMSPERRNSHAPMLVSTSILMFYLLYLYLTRTTFDIFNCSPTDPDDGFLYLEAVFERCWESDTHKLLFPLAVTTCVVYVLAYPALVFRLLSKNKDLVKVDQLLRAHNIDDEVLKTLPNVYAFRKSYSKMYYQFKPGKWYWQPVVVARKFSIAVTSLMFRDTPSFQMAMIVMVLFFSYAAHVKQVPYMSTSERRAEVLYHEQKILEGDPRHMKLDVDIKKALRKTTSRHQGRGMDQLKKTKGPEATFITNFNTVETVLLTCAILVAMAAILFESRRLKDGRSPEVRETLVWLTLLLIVGSIVYFVIICVMEIMDTKCAGTLGRTFKCCKAKKSTIELEVERGMAGMRAAMPDSADTAFNPMLAGNLADEKAKHALSPEEEQAVLALLQQPGVPNMPKWQAIRIWVLSKRKATADAAEELRGLKRNATVASAKASLSKDSDERRNKRPKGRGKSKRNFAQAASRRSTSAGRKGPAISKASASRMRGQ